MKSDSSFQQFLNEMGKHPLLTPEQELILGRQVQRMLALQEEQAQGRELTKAELREVKAGMRAKERMVNCNLRLVVLIAKRYVKRVHHLTMLDLIQEGVIGLMRGVEKYDPARGYKFSTYAYWWIRQGVARSVNQQETTIKLPTTVAEAIPKLRKATQELTQSLGRTPTKQELADEMQMPIHQLCLMCERTRAMTSLDATFSDDGSPLVDLMPDQASQNQDALFEVDDRMRLEAALEKLSERARHIIEARHELTGQQQRTYQSLAMELGISRESVKQQERRSLRALRTYMRGMSPLADPQIITNLASHREKDIALMRLRSSAKQQNQLKLVDVPNGFR